MLSCLEVIVEDRVEYSERHGHRSLQHSIAEHKHSIALCYAMLYTACSASGRRLARDELTAASTAAALAYSIAWHKNGSGTHMCCAVLMLSYVMLCYAMLCYAMLWYAMLCYGACRVKGAQA